MIMRNQTHIISVFGQIAGIVADAMVVEGKAKRIEPDDIPISVRYNKAGEKAHCALVVSNEAEAEFDRRRAQLSA
jgi:hypothetical protein